METTKVLTTGSSQAVQVPEQFHLDCDDVFIRRIGKMLILIPKEDAWEVFSKSLSEFSDDYMKDGRDQGILPERCSF